MRGSVCSGSQGGESSCLRRRQPAGGYLRRCCLGARWVCLVPSLFVSSLPSMSLLPVYLYIVIFIIRIPNCCLNDDIMHYSAVPSSNMHYPQLFYFSQTCSFIRWHSQQTHTYYTHYLLRRRVCKPFFLFPSLIVHHIDAVTSKKCYFLTARFYLSGLLGDDIRNKMSLHPTCSKYLPIL